MQVPIALTESAPHPSRALPVPSVSPDHFCQFYESDEFLCEAVSGFLAEGLRGKQAVLLVATAEHVEPMLRRLGEAGLDVARAVRTGQLVTADAQTVLDAFMDDGRPDPARFRAAVGSLIARLRSEERTVRIFGEMVDVLWRDGNSSGALRLEELWNELAGTHPFQLLCGYSMGNFYRASHGHDFADVCAQHARALPTEVYPLGADEAAKEREISLLQQRARSLEVEIDQRRQLEHALREALAERSRTEAALLEAKDEAERAVRVKSEFLAVMSHELRTPLNAILGYQDLLEHGVGGVMSAEQRAYLSRMRTCSQQLLRLIDQVLNLSRVEASRIELHPEPVDALLLARETLVLIEPTAERRGLTVEARGVGGAFEVTTDPGTVRQILLNLLSNAIRFTDAGWIRVEVEGDEESVSIAVSDTGIGIDGADLERIFEPFVRLEEPIGRRRGGTGLGLAVSRDLARLLAGELTAESEPRVGSTFTLRLPRVPEAPLGV